MGGALLQQVNRDTSSFAMKASWAVVDGKGVDVYKDPITSNGKRSKKGRLTLYRNKETGKIFTGRMAHGADKENDVLLREVLNTHSMK
jgi:nicotinic acid phosphoribosyltransferase